MIPENDYHGIWLEADDLAKKEGAELNQTKEWIDERRQEHIKRMLK